MGAIILPAVCPHLLPFNLTTPYVLYFAQVEAADKQLRATRLFLEEQAAEREQERDDFLQEISKLQELVRERDHDRGECERLTKEVSFSFCCSTHEVFTKIDRDII
jgi:hypothetical protein